MGKSSKPKFDPTDGSWVAMSLRFLRSRAFCELSPHAVKMMLELMSRFSTGARGNGDLSVPASYLVPRGWISGHTRKAALSELEAAGLLVVTRQGSKRRCYLYALTLWPMEVDDYTKLDVGPGCYKRTDWRSGKHADRDVPPGASDPATWGGVRSSKKNTSGLPDSAQKSADVVPLRHIRVRA